MHRRDFFRLAGAASAFPFIPALQRSFAAPRARSATLIRAPLTFPSTVSPTDLSLSARVHTVEIAPGVSAEVWSAGDGPVGPTIDTRTGETARITFDNALPEPTILHWHCLRVPEADDGHPALAIPTGSSYRYEFPIRDRAGTYWYHAHPHHRTGMQAYRGMVGLLLIRDDAEDRLGLPSGSREIPLLIQDRRLDADGRFAYDPVMHEQMEGFLGDTPFANGIRLPAHDVETTTYRLRVVNACTSRILRLALSTGRPMTLIGGDGGLLPIKGSESLLPIQPFIEGSESLLPIKRSRGQSPCSRSSHLSRGQSPCSRSSDQGVRVLAPDPARVLDRARTLPP